MLLSADSWPGIVDGSITVTFRAWKRPQAKVGGRYRIAGMLIEVSDLRQIPLAEITPEDAATAGSTDLEALVRRLGGADPVWRVDFAYLGPDDRIAKRNDTSEEDLSAVISRLGRLDRNAPWTARRCSSSIATRASSRPRWHGMPIRSGR